MFWKDKCISAVSELIWMSGGSNSRILDIDVIELNEHVPKCIVCTRQIKKLKSAIKIMLTNKAYIVVMLPVQRTCILS